MASVVARQRRDTRLRFEQWARNPLCEANAISAVHGVPMAEVAKREGTKPTMGQSPFAIARGQTFERSLFREDATRLREALVKAGVLAEGAEGFRDFRLRLVGGPYHALDEALAATAEFLRQLASAQTRRERAAIPGVIAGAVVRIPGGMMLPEAILVIDVLLTAFGKERPSLTVGEIKTYPDRGGYTDDGELATARAQAGVYVHGLRLVLEDLGLSGKIDVLDTGFLVLSRPGYSVPSIRANEDLRYQAARAERGFARLREIAARIGMSADDETIIRAVQGAPVRYADACVSFCDRAQSCHAAALRAGDPAVLGEDIARFLSDTTLTRALALLAGGRPSNIAEEDLLRRIAEADREGVRR